MKLPKNAFEIFLQPGEFYWGDADTRIRTILGSCVAVTVWHPAQKVGGMCHIMLPSRARSAKKTGGVLNGKYADEAMTMIMSELNSCGIAPESCHVKVFGGSNMFKTLRDISNPIGDRNLEAVMDQLDRLGFTVHSHHHGGELPRYIIFDVWSGWVWLRKH
ncbi:chemotaxis protein CheD [Methylophilus aquaticus]|uniref:Probable chemoreceptor glutamine deamidase CheD n=1 Tax=Methylophilus aquaticus TaxID=1971610 RepID=A0ABT9JS27_9PROT|nr:chemotaxis protein CheD [Methylophilus aquaticus]MDP8567336.1 chemotaxis protein CheD [Methylophilus aquaticus]